MTHHDGVGTDVTVRHLTHDELVAYLEADGCGRVGVVVSTPAALDALPVGSVVRGDDGHPWEKVYATFTARAVWHTVRSHGDYESTVAGLLPATLLHVPGRDLLAEAEARGYERGKRDALTEAADAAEVRWPGLITFRNWLRARAAETPGGAA